MGSFNFWFVLAPLLILGAVALGMYSITRVNGHPVKRWSGMHAPRIYSAVATAVVGILVLLESPNGLLQCGLNCLSPGESEIYGAIVAIFLLAGFLFVYYLVCWGVYALSADRRELYLTQQYESYQARYESNPNEEGDDYADLEAIFRRRDNGPAICVLYTKDLVPLVREARVMGMNQVYMASVPVRRRHHWWQTHAQSEAVYDLQELAALRDTESLPAPRNISV